MYISPDFDPTVQCTAQFSCFLQLFADRVRMCAAVVRNLLLTIVFCILTNPPDLALSALLKNIDHFGPDHLFQALDSCTAVQHSVSWDLPMILLKLGCIAYVAHGFYHLPLSDCLITGKTWQGQRKLASLR